MCTAPIKIPNPDYMNPLHKHDPLWASCHNWQDSHIEVPCGHCAACVHLGQVYLVQRVQMEAINNDLFYGTLTYNQDSLPIAEYGDIRFAYPSFDDWQKMIKMIRKDYPSLKFKYMLVSEYGGKKHRPIIIFYCRSPGRQIC